MSTLTLPAPLARRAAEGTLTHGWLIAGAGEETLERAAQALAAAFLCEGPEGGKVRPASPIPSPQTPSCDSPAEKPCGVCKHCRKVEKGVHPDLIWVEKRPDKTQLLVDQVRALRKDAYIRPNEARRKVYILKHAELMNDEAQNAFLKVLEEGPAYAAFLLLAENHLALLPTVRSRCELWHCNHQDAGDEELKRRGGELAGLLLGDDPWRLVSWCVPYEKAKREEVLPLWESTRRALLTYRKPETTAKAVALARTLDDILAAGRQNGNMGVLWGKLWAAATTV